MAMYIPYAILKHGLYSGLIDAVGTVTFGTCNIVKSMYAKKNPDVLLIIKELDIERKLKVVQSVVNAIEHSNETGQTKLKLNDLEKTQIFQTISAKNASIDCDPIEISLKYLKQTIQDINNDLQSINQKMGRYNKKWFKSWRKLNIQQFLDSLKLNAKLLDLRYDDLTKIFLFLKNKNK